MHPILTFPLSFSSYTLVGCRYLRAGVLEKVGIDLAVFCLGGKVTGRPPLPLPKMAFSEESDARFHLS